MKLTVLGCSGTFGAPDCACSGYLVQAGGASVLLDAGPGTLAELQRHMRIEDLDALLISHSHPDHWVEAPVMRNALRYVLQSEGLPVYSTSETLGLITEISHDRVEPTFELSEISDGAEVSVGPLRIRCSRTDHPPETLAFCLDDGERRLAYSADTGPGWSFSEFGAAVDLAICEATFRDGTPIAEQAAFSDVGIHLTALEAGAMARASGARSLLLTHLLPGEDREGAKAEAASAYGGEVAVAGSGLVVDL